MITLHAQRALLLSEVCTEYDYSFQQEDDVASAIINIFFFKYRFSVYLIKVYL